MATLVEVIEGLRERPGDLLGPAYAEISLVGACNFGCVQCHQHHHIAADRTEHGRPGARSLELGRVLELLDELASLGVPTLELCGRGEPTLFRGLPAVIRRAKALGMRGTLVTNGSRLRGEVVTAIAEAAWDEVSVSMYAGTEAHFRAVSRPRGGVTLDAIVANVAALRSRAPGTRLTVAWLLQVDALGGLEGMFDLLDRLDADEHQFLPIVPYADGRMLRGDAHARADADFAARLEAAVTAVAARRELPAQFAAWVQRHLADPVTDTITTTYAQVPCYAGRWAVFVCDDGTVRPCSNSNWSMGDLREQSLAEIWRGAEYERFRGCAARHILQTGRPIPDSACSHCGWARLQRQVHEAVTAGSGPPGSWVLDPY